MILIINGSVWAQGGGHGGHGHSHLSIGLGYYGPGFYGGYGGMDAAVMALVDMVMAILITIHGLMLIRKL